MENILLPPGLIIVFGVVALLLWRRSQSVAKIIAVTGLLLLYLLATPLVANFMIGLLDKFPYLHKGSKTDAQAIVILGGGSRLEAPEYRRDALTAQSLERLRYGAELHRQRGLPVLLSGGIVYEATRSEASLMQGVMEDLFYIEAQWLEDKSRNTEENARYSSKLLQDQGITSVILVTHYWHMPRAYARFEKYGMRVTAAPMGRGVTKAGWLGQWLPTMSSMQRSRNAMREMIGISWYLLRY